MAFGRKGRKTLVVEKRKRLKKMGAWVVAFVVLVGFQERKLVVVLEEEQRL